MDKNNERTTPRVLNVGKTGTPEYEEVDKFMRGLIAEFGEEITYLAQHYHNVCTSHSGLLQSTMMAPADADQTREIFTDSFAKIMSFATVHANLDGMKVMQCAERLISMARVYEAEAMAASGLHEADKSEEVSEIIRRAATAG